MPPKSYKYVVHNGKLDRLHRVVYEQNFGPIPDGFHVHHIDEDIHNNDPSNLVALSPRDHILAHRGVVHPTTKTCLTCGQEYAPTNRNRGRSKFCSPACAVTGRTGELHPGAVLTEDEVREIRKRFADGETQASLSRSFGVTSAAIWRIVNRRCWKHIDQEAA